MGDGLHAFWLCFVPFFVAVDPIGMVPLFPALTSGALVANMALLAGALFCAARINRLFGKAGVKAVSEVANLILAAFAVMFIREDIAIRAVGGLGP